MPDDGPAKFASCSEIGGDGIINRWYQSGGKEKVVTAKFVMFLNHTGLKSPAVAIAYRYGTVNILPRELP